MAHRRKWPVARWKQAQIILILAMPISFHHLCSLLEVLVYFFLLFCYWGIKIQEWNVFGYAWEIHIGDYAWTVVGNSFYANGPACAKSVLESCHLLDMELLLQNRRIKWQIAWLCTIFHLPNQTSKRGRRNQKLNMMILSHLCQYHHSLSLTHAHSLL